MRATQKMNKQQKMQTKLEAFAARLNARHGLHELEKRDNLLEDLLVLVNQTYEIMPAVFGAIGVYYEEGRYLVGEVRSNCVGLGDFQNETYTLRAFEEDVLDDAVNCFYYLSWAYRLGR